MSPEREAAMLLQLAHGQRAEAPSLRDALREVVATRYEWRPGETHVAWSEVRRRGYAACGEAAAFVAAAAMREGRHTEIRIVTGPPSECGPGYRHAVAVVDGMTLDPYKQRACPAPHVALAAGRWTP